MIHAVYDVTRCTTSNPEPAALLRAMHATVNRLGCTVLGEQPVLSQPHGITCVLAQPLHNRATLLLRRTVPLPTAR